MAFSMSLSIVLSRTIGQKDLGVLQDSLLGLGMMMELAALKWKGQYSRLKHALAMFKIFTKQLLSETKGLRCLQEI